MELVACAGLVVMGGGGGGGERDIVICWLGCPLPLSQAYAGQWL